MVERIVLTILTDNEILIILITGIKPLNRISLVHSGGRSDFLLTLIFRSSLLTHHTNQLGKYYFMLGINNFKKEHFSTHNENMVPGQNSYI
jgi:hypothetical protein